MYNKKFEKVAMNEDNPKWNCAIKRLEELYKRNNDIRTEFERDYTRILHSTAYRRLKHKTQVFFETHNDLVCTRIEHVNHVESVSSTIAKALGLNRELTAAISIGHDLGHAPFGHEGEKVLSELSQKHLGCDFWHEKNGLRVVDSLEQLENNYRKLNNLNLTYAVRDGIISHCGEVDDTTIFPRDEAMDLKEFKKGKTNPYTWEACVVKLADKIAYVGRDIEDAIRLRLLHKTDLFYLKDIAKKYKHSTINTTTIIHDLITNVCENSSPENGLSMSKQMSDFLIEIKKYNYEKIYNHKRLDTYKKYVDLVIKSIFYTLYDFFDGKDILRAIRHATYYPNLYKTFSDWLVQHSDVTVTNHNISFDVWRRSKKCEKVYGDLSDKKQYVQAIIDYISCMTDVFAINIFNELCRF